MEKAWTVLYALLLQGSICVSGQAAPVTEKPRTKLMISTIVEAPFLEMTDISVDGNDRFSGFLKDLLVALTTDLDVDFELVPVNDGQYGRKIRRDLWDGMVGELLRKEVDMAAAPLVPTAERREVVDFSRPFMQGGITMLMYRDPDSNNKTKGPPIRSPEELLSKPDIVPGFVEYTSIQTFFEKSNDPTYRNILRRMYETTLKPNPFALTVEEGIFNLRSYKSKYVFFVDSNFAEYYAAKWPCDLVLVGELHRQSFAFAFSKNSTLRRKFNRLLEKMKDNGELARLVQKWWTGNCESKVGEYKYQSPKQTVGQAVEAVAGQTKGGSGVGDRWRHSSLLIIITVLIAGVICS